MGFRHGFSLGSDPRALPSVTHGSALQAPERLRILPSTLKELQAHSPGESEATPWVTGYTI